MMWRDLQFSDSNVELASNSDEWLQPGWRSTLSCFLLITI